ncbi:tetratricopeptide repeat protein [Oceanibacterium hippocampi]|nr:tetratricopeptide repeat protein [Oceanibacterium hippocampi]
MTHLLVGALALASVAASTGVAILLLPPGIQPPEVDAAHATTSDGNAAARPGAGPSKAEIAERVARLEQRLKAEEGKLDDWKMLGRSYVTLGRYGEAVSAWVQAATVAPNDPEVRGALARLQEIADQRGRHPTSSQ